MADTIYILLIILILLNILILIMIILAITHKRPDEHVCVRDNFELIKDECGLYPLQGLGPDYGSKAEEGECTRFVRAP